MLTLYMATALMSIVSCRPAQGNADSLLRHAASVVGPSNRSSVALHWTGFDITSHPHESDRTYPPYLSDITPVDAWFNPANGVESIARRSVSFTGQTYPGAAFLSNGSATFVVRDSVAKPSGAAAYSMYALRPLDVLAVLHDWLGASHVIVEQQCRYRDYDRIVLERPTPDGPERLYLDPKSGFPIKLDRIEPHYLWGQVHVEYVYSTWQRVTDGYLPGESFRVVDGSTEVERLPGSQRFVAVDSAAQVALPASPAMVKRTLPGFLDPTRPDTIRVGPRTFILRNQGYSGVVTLAHDTVYIFDSSQAEARARLDSGWIAELFPGRHPVALIVTDIAWPHVGGLRFWVARGATVISHRAARDFLQRVVDRRWTLSPDLLERERRHVTFHFVPVSNAMTVAGGAIRIFPIDGASSEVALAVYVESERFLWASDFVQTLDAPTTYLDEVWRATAREHLHPVQVAAEHLPLSQWSKVEALAPSR